MSGGKENASSVPYRSPLLPDLALLTEPQKDELIISLWETVVALDAARTPAAPASTPTSTQALTERIRAAAPLGRTHVGRPSVSRLGAGLDLLSSRPLQWLLLLIGLGFLADYGIGWYQRWMVAQHEKAALSLRSAALKDLYAELSRITYEPDSKTYRATMTMQNLNPAQPLYVMLDPTRVFIQAGLAWREVPSRAAAEAGWGVVRLNGTSTISILFETSVDGWSELIPGYMHMQIESNVLISRNPTPGDDIVSRNNRFYAYLKPQGANDETIKNRNAFPGSLPVFIPMPPH